ncbi:MAG: CD1845 family protein [Oscillospiraceae bacterium]|nr:CD1845 family protein [Oscillospiraceae bacterium]
MRIILKILATPFVLALTLAGAILIFLHGIAGAVLDILCGLVVLISLFTLFIEKDTAYGIQGMVIAFCISPVGLPAVAEWLIVKLDDFNYSLKCFITD